VRAVLQSGADVIDRGLSVFYVEGGGFEEDVGFRGFKPGANLSG